MEPSVNRPPAPGTLTDARTLVDLSGQTAIVTGGAQGLGAGIARRLACAGCSVVLTDVDDSVRDTARQMSAAGLAVTPDILDVADSSAVDALAGRVDRERGSVDIWVNNAGLYPVDGALRMADESWHRVLDVNLSGTFYGCRAAGRLMAAAGRGVILNVSSVAASRVTADGRTHYAASKAGIEALTRALARELGPSGVRVLAIAPTIIHTDGVQDVLPGLQASPAEPDVFARYAAALPLRRTAQADDIARVALFCVSGLAGYVTGVTIPVDGGQLAV
jgi:NAD(P)-dependent dehydrogenase (short-subunit alcohol dehydrogenase family)